MTRALAGIGAIVMLACTQTAPDHLAITSPLTNGELTKGDGAVVALVRRRGLCDEQQAQIVCTGTLIAPRVVLTAARCLDEFPGPGGIEVVSGADAWSSGTAKYVNVVGGARHPLWKRGAVENDVALLRLAEALPVAPIPIGASVGESDLEKPLQMVSFGLATAAAEQPDGRKRQGSLVVREVKSTLFLADASPHAACRGDTGAPLFRRRDGLDQLVGVVGSGQIACETLLTAARVDVFSEFVASFVSKTASTPVGMPSGAPLEALCATTCREPSQCPALFPCVTFGATGRCQLGEPPGDYQGRCSNQTECANGEVCARVWATGEGACRCLRACAAGGTPDAGRDRPPSVRAMGGGCTFGGPNTRAAWLLVIVSALASRRRRRRLKFSAAGRESRCG